VPLNFGYEDGTLYFHSAPAGRKIDFIAANDRVCFEFDLDHELVTADAPCRWTMKFRSVVGTGRAAIVEDGKERMRGLKAIMRHYARLAGGGDFADDDFERAVLAKTAVIRVDIESLTGKQSGY
jgi:nitroimidazol reductase NimA-like FMN-containing flavoprotein (pyridoxamine 5'-phosphate oxidase superfamily)